MRDEGSGEELRRTSLLDAPFTLRQIGTSLGKSIGVITSLIGVLLGYLLMFAWLIAAGRIAFGDVVHVSDSRWVKDNVLLSDFRTDQKECRRVSDFEPEGVANSLNRGFEVPYVSGTYFPKSRWSAYTQCIEGCGYHLAAIKP